ncbi:MAG: hypothetical protein OEZ36_04275 [Spirochaetota bacterium]|nr:hypothetical protein [Spirochaetota bacterium]
MAKGLTATIINISDVNALLKVAKACHSNNKHLKALFYLKKVIGLKPETTVAHSLSASIYELLNDNSMALYHYETLLTLQNLNWTTKHHIISLYLAEKNYSRALELIKRRVHWLFGDLSWMKRCVSRIQNHQHIQNQLEKSYFQIAYLLREEGQYNLAARYAKKLIRTKNDPIYRYLLATIYEAKADYSRAQREFSLIQKVHCPITPQFYEKVYSKILEHQLIPDADAV